VRILFIDSVYAMGGAPVQGGGGAFSAFVPLILIFVIFYFLLIRPQQKKQKDHRKMIDSLKKGDEVVTSGGIHGSIAKVKDDIVHLEVSEQIKLRVSRSAIAMIKKKSE
jgi:preprotein translocase subunit YajC